ncbi:MAG: LacI family transcriptional regulator [Firmicutes bacterium]|nr:LacI family transcriptional regulator [Bacillota bacterium]
MAVTIHDVAREAGVSLSTVSRVFNNKGNISNETRERVIAAAAKLGYRPRAYKKQENTAKKNIGIIFSKRLGSLIQDSFSFYAQVMAGVEEILIPHNYEIFFRTISGKAKEDAVIINELTRDERLAGLILAGYDIEPEIILRIKRSNIPLVLTDNELVDENIDCVVNDNVAGARKIVKHLIGLGHRRIAFCGGPLSHNSLNERYQGYKQALKEAGLEQNKQWVFFCEPSFNIEDGYTAAMRIFTGTSPIPTAVFAANDPLAIGVMKALKELGYRIPEEISVAGFDDIPMAEHTAPSLTTVRIYKNEMGVLAGKRLHELIQGINPKPFKIVMSVDPVLRDSTGTLSAINL